MKKLVCVAAVSSLALAACSEPSVEDQFFASVEEKVVEIENLAEQDRVCLTHVMEISSDEDEELVPLAEAMEEKYGANLPEEYESRMEEIANRMESAMMAVMPKMDADC